MPSPRLGEPPSSSPCPQDPQFIGDLFHNHQVATIIYGRVGKKANFLAITRDAIATFLSGFPVIQLARLNLNFKCNLVAVDMPPTTDMNALLQVEVICKIKVWAKQLDLNACVGMIYRVDPSIPLEDHTHLHQCHSCAVCAEATAALSPLCGLSSSWISCFTSKDALNVRSSPGHYSVPDDATSGT